MEHVPALLGIGTALAVGAASPGPSFVMVARTAVASSRVDAIYAALGMGVGGLFFAVISLLGLHGLLLAVPSLYWVLRILGGSYLVYLGVRIWLGARKPLFDHATEARLGAKSAVRHDCPGIETGVRGRSAVIQRCRAVSRCGSGVLVEKEGDMKSFQEQILPRATSGARYQPSSIPGRRLAAAMAAAVLSGIGMSAVAQDKPVGEVVTQDGKVRVEVLSLKRIEGNLVTLRWRLVNDGSSNFSVTPGNMRLIDLAGRRQYEPGLMSSGCFAKPDERTVCWATFAAPPAATKTLAVKFYEQFDLLAGIPITD